MQKRYTYSSLLTLKEPVFNFFTGQWTVNPFCHCPHAALFIHPNRHGLRTQQLALIRVHAALHCQSTHSAMCCKWDTHSDVVIWRLDPTVGRDSWLPLRQVSGDDRDYCSSAFPVPLLNFFLHASVHRYIQDILLQVNAQ